MNMKGRGPMRKAEIIRKTRETHIKVSLNLDGVGNCKIDTGIGFFDHMLTALFIHSGIDAEVICKGDLHVDSHHSIEDTGICIGMTLKQALSDKMGIARYGSAFLPMDESLAFCSLDISSRAFLVFNADFKSDLIGSYDTSMTQEFFRAVAFNAGLTLHLKIEYGLNDHHKTEAIYKAFAHALKQAITINRADILSTKGVL